MMQREIERLAGLGYGLSDSDELAHERDDDQLGTLARGLEQA